MDLKWKLVKRPLLLWAQLDYRQKLCKTQTRWSSDGSQIDHHTLIWVCEIYMAIPLSPNPMMSWSLVVVMNSLLSGIFTPVLQLRQFETALICDYDFLILHFSTQILRISPASRTEAIYWRDQRSKKNRQRIFLPYPISISAISHGIPQFKTGNASWTAVGFGVVPAFRCLLIYFYWQIKCVKR